MAKKLWKKKRDSFHRKIGKRGKPKDRILIICEGEKTEPNYFRGFRVTSARIIIKGLGYDPSSLINFANEEKDLAKKEGEEYQQIWCVFDRDSFPTQNFNNAIRKAKRHGIKVAYSNEAFEIWYILHFNYFDAAISRDRYSTILKKNLGHQYLKNSKDMYMELIELQDSAIRNAKKLLTVYNPINPEANNPSTTVHKLVENLNKYK